jgi:hypothetical protein
VVWSLWFVVAAAVFLVVTFLCLDAKKVAKEKSSLQEAMLNVKCGAVGFSLSSLRSHLSRLRFTQQIS